MMRFDDIGNVYEQIAEGDTVYFSFNDNTYESGIIIQITQAGIKFKLLDTDSDIELCVSYDDIDKYKVVSRNCKELHNDITPADIPDTNKCKIIKLGESSKKQHIHFDKTKAEQLVNDINSNTFKVSKSSRNISPLLIVDARIPMEYWAAGWVFRDIMDKTWREITANSKVVFPATLRKDHISHPGYIMAEFGTEALDIAPMTSRKKGSRPYISAGSRLEPTGHIMDKKSHIIKGAMARIYRGHNMFSTLPRFLGIYPPEKL